jgi:predicted O-linked N-acetylglucosamine transferase (SPINDLY family)
MMREQGRATTGVPSTDRALGVIDLIRAAEKLKLGGELFAVESLYEGWIRANPDHPLLYAVLFNFSVILSDAGQIAEAKACLQRALELNPGFLPAYINLGRAFERLGDVPAAVRHWSGLLDQLPSIDAANIGLKTAALNQIARTLEAGNQDEPAEDMLRRSLEIDPQQREVAQHFLALRQRACHWPVVAPWERVGRDILMRGMSPLSAAAYTDDPLLQLAMAWNYNVTDVGTPETAMDSWPMATTRGGPLRIGYLSSDLREHAVGHLMAEVFNLHDRSAVEIFAYYCGPATTDPLHSNFIAAADHWVDVTGMDDASAARKIADDGIQILVDVNGYTREGRTKLLALRPAPIIVNWLGFPGTLGSPYHHYIVADDWIIPPDHEHYYSEKVLRLPCYQPNNRKRLVADICPTRSQAGLPEDGIVFCCFNGTHKITRFTLDRWLTILEGVAGSVLWLLAGTEGTNQRMRSYAAKRGIAPERLVFAPKIANPHHLSRYKLADLFLDTTPYGAHTTASDALWMGVPVLTVSGRCFASRVCGSLTRSAGLPELVCRTPDDFVKQAIALGCDRAALRLYREKLLAGRDTCVLFDTPLLVRELEALYRRMWTDLEADRLPCPDLTNLETYLQVGAKHDHEALEVQSIESYEAWWRERLERHNRFRPIPPDKRLLGKS